MKSLSVNDPNLVQFDQAYHEFTAEPVRLDEFVLDDLYAFRVLQRALTSHSASLRNLAEHLLVLRADVTESITIKPVDHLNETKRMQTLQPAAPMPERAPERRIKDGRFTPEQTEVLGQYQSLYAQEFGEAFDSDQFASNDLYGRAVLLRSLTANNPSLLSIARHFIDDSGTPVRHRRNARPEEKKT